MLPRAALPAPLSLLRPLCLLCLLCLLCGGLAGADGAYDVQPFTYNLSAGVPHMLSLINSTVLPDEPEYAGIGSSMGIDLDVLKSMQKQWLDDFDWEEDQAYINTFSHYTVTLDGLSINFIHQRSNDSGAIPLLLTHGWPGSFLEYLPVVANLTQTGTTAKGRAVAYNVVVPSYPGFGLSTKPPGNWTLADTTRIFNTLMTDVLGYGRYAVSGTSSGAYVAFHLYDGYNATARAALFPLFPFDPSTPEDIQQLNVTLSPLEQFELERTANWTATGSAYYLEHATKPETIGLALYDNPMGQLAWMGEKWFGWGDPRDGQYPSVLTHHEILRSVTLYYLSKSFLSSIYIYAQDPGDPFVNLLYRRARTDAPMIASNYKYDIAFWSYDMLRLFGNLVAFNNHKFGGFWPGLENPPAFLSDLRELRDYWTG